MDDRWAPGLIIAAGVALGLVLGVVLVITFGALPVGAPVYGDEIRTGFAKWLFDWQQLVAGFLAVAAAGAAATLVWKQLESVARQAAAAERQAYVAVEDSLSRRLATLHQLESRVRSVTKRAREMELSASVAQVDARAALIEMQNGVGEIERATLSGLFGADALGSMGRYATMGRRFVEILESLIDSLKANDQSSLIDAVKKAASVERDLPSAKIARDAFLAMEPQALEAMRAEIAPLEQRRQELRDALLAK